MKRVVLSIILVSLCILSFAQVPESFNYQAIIRDGGATVSEQSVFYRFSIIKGELPGEVVYTEKHNPTTSEIGLVTLAIGKGTDKSGDFTTIDWGADIYSLNVELDMEGDGSYADMGTTQLLSVPYSLHSKTATSYTETDPLFGGWNKSTDISITASQVSDFETGVTNNPAVIANTAKTSYPSADAEKLAAITGTNTGDETNATIKTKLGITTLSGSNTGDQNLASILELGTDAGNKKIVNLNQQGIGTATPNSSAALEISSTTQGFLMSRVTNIQRDAIINPEQGLLIYNTSENNIQLFNGTIWQNLTMSLCTTPTAPATINGNSRVENNSNGLEYNISEVPNASSYYWTVPTDAIITSGQGTKSIFVNFGTQRGNVSVQSVNGCGTSLFTNKEVFVGTLQIGDSFAGGIVFYVDGSGNHGLVCASIDLGRDAVPWGCQGTTISGADGTSIGTGSQNTTDIINGCTTVGIAAKICRSYSGGNYNDWFLPSKDELNLIYLNISNKYILNFDDTYYYWSSSESSSTNAWNQKVINGSQYSDPKSTTGYSAVRPIRVF